MTGNRTVVRVPAAGRCWSRWYRSPRDDGTARPTAPGDSAGRQGSGWRPGRAADGFRVVNAGERLVTVLVTVAVPEPSGAEDAAPWVADAVVSGAVGAVEAVGVEGDLTVAGSTVMS